MRAFGPRGGYAQRGHIRDFLLRQPFAPHNPCTGTPPFASILCPLASHTLSSKHPLEPPHPHTTPNLHCMPCSLANTSPLYHPPFLAMQVHATAQCWCPTGTPTPSSPAPKTLGPVLDLASATCLCCLRSPVWEDCCRAQPCGLVACGARSVRRLGAARGLTCGCPGSFSSDFSLGAHLVGPVFGWILACSKSPFSC